MTRRLPAAFAVLGWLLVAAGVVVFWFANRPDGSGWTAYTGSYEPLRPGEGGAYQSVLLLEGGWAVFWTGTHVVGAGLAVLGLLVLVGLVGWLLGRRSKPSSIP
jgi:hypothetical protein